MDLAARNEVLPPTLFGLRGGLRALYSLAPRPYAAVLDVVEDGDQWMRTHCK